MENTKQQKMISKIGNLLISYINDYEDKDKISLSNLYTPC